ncbi:MAG: sigma-70 family RNA polymerase sigma factor [Deltaproteobacteria bacterium]|nr:sigma-70 family RNA polymerase sigma factor [Deltaproteobacteria bacterium]
MKKKEAQVVRLADHFLCNEEIVRGIINKDPRAAAVLYDRFGNKINRLVWRLLGADSEHDDVVQLVFVHILSSVKKLKNPDALEDWISGVTVNTVRREIRNRKYRRILIPTADYPEIATDPGEARSKIMVHRLFAILSKMRTEDHIVFVLRFVEGNTLGEVAVAGGYSLATAKRRIARAKKEFMKRAKKDSVLASFIEEMKND